MRPGGGAGVRLEGWGPDATRTEISVGAGWEMMATHGVPFSLRRQQAERPLRRMQ